MKDSQGYDFMSFSSIFSVVYSLTLNFSFSRFAFILLRYCEEQTMKIFQSYLIQNEKEEMTGTKDVQTKRGSQWLPQIFLNDGFKKKVLSKKLIY